MANLRAGNRQLRTRKDLLQAAARLLESGKQLSMEDIAKEALVSRATVYRYFSDINDLMTEVAIDASVPDAKEIFRDSRASGIAGRLDHAEAVMHDYVYKNEPQLRVLLSRSISKPTAPDAAVTAPARQNRRTEYIEEALAPYRAQLDNKTFKKLSEALALVFGPEAMIVFRDVIHLDPHRAREVKRWMITALVSAALQESKKRIKRGKTR